MKLPRFAVINSKLRNVAAGQASRLGLLEPAMVEDSGEYIVGFIANGTFTGVKVDISSTRFASSPM